MEAEEFLLTSATFIGTYALAWFFTALAFLLLAVGLSMYLLRRYPLWHESGQHSIRVLIGRFVIGFVIIVGCGILFAGIADEIDLEEDLARFDLSLTQAVSKNTPPAIVQTFAYITHLGDPITLIVLGVIVAVALFFYGQRWLALGWVIAVAGNGLLNPALKMIFERMRPLGDHGQPLVAGWSFPSGHSSGAVVVYGMLSYVLVCMTPTKWHLPIVLLAAALAFSTGGSRLFLHYHYASDVLAGFASGTAWLAVCISAMEYTRWRSRRNNA